EDGKYRTDTVCSDRDSGGSSRFTHSRHEASGALFQLRVDRFVSQNPECCETGCNCEEITRERSCLINRASRGHLLHNVSAAPKSAYRQSSANDLAEAGEVRFDLVQALSATPP